MTDELSVCIQCKKKKLTVLMNNNGRCLSCVETPIPKTLIMLKRTIHLKWIITRIVNMQITKEELLSMYNEAEKIKTIRKNKKRMGII